MKRDECALFKGQSVLIINGPSAFIDQEAFSGTDSPLLRLGQFLVSILLFDFCAYFFAVGRVGFDGGASSLWFSFQLRLAQRNPSFAVCFGANSELPPPPPYYEE